MRLARRFQFLALTTFVAVSLVISYAYPKDPDHKYAASPLKSWFDSLSSKVGPCCSDADGTALVDADWEARDGRYRVRIPDKRFPGNPATWVDVPAEAVLETPNRDGRTIVWPMYGYSGMTIRCFIPGSMT